MTKGLDLQPFTDNVDVSIWVKQNITTSKRDEKQHIKNLLRINYWLIFPKIPGRFVTSGALFSVTYRPKVSLTESFWSEQDIERLYSGTAENSRTGDSLILIAYTSNKILKEFNERLRFVSLMWMSFVH